MSGRPGGCLAHVAPSRASNDTSGRLSDVQALESEAVGRTCGTRPSRVHVHGIRTRLVRLVVAGLALTLAGAAFAEDRKGKRAEPPKVTHPMHIVIVAD